MPRLDDQVTDAEVAALSDDDLPTYTILVPMFREPEVLPILAGAIRRLDYPLAKLDVKLVLEEGDQETIDAAKRLGLESIFEIVRVPPSQPQTKPKACNYALSFARGELLVIYDAEDKPEPDQLKKAVVGFRKSPENTACLQARLNYFNADENWLTRLFTIDYSLWFDFMLPALDYLKMPIPLGGTSNHFRTEVLRELRAWDPYNVTEDADLGVRLTQEGYRVGVINSTTFEEANVSVGNWIRQRSRWLKGYMQTYLVHMRRPVHLFRSLGPSPFLGFQFFVGGNIVAGLGAPVFWGIYAVWFVHRDQDARTVLPGRAALPQPLQPDHRQCGPFTYLAGGGAAEAASLPPGSVWPDGGRLLDPDLDRRLQGPLATDHEAVLLGEDAARHFQAHPGGGGGGIPGGCGMTVISWSAGGSAAPARSKPLAGRDNSLPAGIPGLSGRCGLGPGARLCQRRGAQAVGGRPDELAEPGFRRGPAVDHLSTAALLSGAGVPTG